MSDPNPPAGTPEDRDPIPPSAPPPSTPPPPPPPPPPPGGMPAAAGAGGVGGALSVGDAFSWAWKKFTENLGPILIAIIVYFAIMIVVGGVWYAIVTSVFLDDPSVVYNSQTGVITADSGSGLIERMIVQALAGSVFFLLFAFLQAAIIRGGLLLADGQKLEIGHMFNFTNYGTVIVAAIIVSLLTSVGYLFCFVGAPIVTFFTAFYLFFVLDKEAGPWESVVSSFTMVKDNAGKVFLLLLAVIGAWILGAVLCLIGLIVAAPVALLALTYGYRTLQGEPVAD